MKAESKQVGTQQESGASRDRGLQCALATGQLAYGTASPGVSDEEKAENQGTGLLKNHVHKRQLHTVSFQNRESFAASWQRPMRTAKRAARKLPSSGAYSFSLPTAAVVPTEMSSRNMYHTIHQSRPMVSATPSLSMPERRVCSTAPTRTEHDHATKGCRVDPRDRQVL